MIDTVNVIILAAGLSRRMGNINKLLIDIDGDPMVRRTASLYRSLFSSVTVITGFENNKVQAALTGLDITTLFNPDFENGQQSSVRIGLHAQYLEGEGVIIALADQPKLSSADITDFTQQFLASDKSKVFVPYFEEQRGNPIIFPSALIEEMRKRGKTVGCRKFIQNNPEHVCKYDVSNSAFIADLDTPHDALRLGLLVFPDGRPVLQEDLSRIKSNMIGKQNNGN